MGERARRTAGAVVALSAAALALVGCGSSAGSDPQTITDWLDAHGVPCQAYGSYDSITVSAVPFTRISCDGVRLDHFDAGAAERYEAFWSADCAAIPDADRAALDSAVVVRGPTWVLRGRGGEGADSWPETLVGAAGVTPAAAADALGGREVTVAEVCRELGAWSA